jgi:hypothetical protein
MYKRPAKEQRQWKTAIATEIVGRVKHVVVSPTAVKRIQRLVPFVDLLARVSFFVRSPSAQ